ncbi:uncharacterized protein LOC133188330 [Saccostrea echinata]|uniref:uncharacterized protein LOC133172380 n=1 Tax=Saccostrea echinata TaxID=191078 RepID=UPI002A838A54|nr:uncharacterized protein LOC133172380 [Saccostrea echinata]XP_061179691.1 uncharacterized protein LOC133188330 [Saccostrea echinata]
MGTPQDLLKCGICCVNRSLPAYCVDCAEKLCAECWKNHPQQVKDDHMVLPMAESKCPEHFKFYAVHCKMCDIPICRDCLIDSHNGHKYSSINQAKDEKIKEVIKYTKHWRENICPVYQALEDQAKAQRGSYESEIVAVKMTINGQREMLKTMVDNLCDDMIESVQTTLAAHSNQINSELQEIVTRKWEIEDEIRKSEGMSEKGILEIKEFLDTLPHLRDSLATPPTLSMPIPSRFFPAEISERTLKRMVGSILQVSMHSSFSCKLPVSNIQACSANEVWVSFHDEKLLTKYSYKQEKGTAVEMENLNLQFKPECFLLLKKDCLLASDRFNHCIWKIENKGKPQTFIKTSPSNPKGMCLNNRQELVVCISGLTGSLRIYFGDKYQNSRDIANHLLNAPNRVAQNGDENYIVLDDHLQTHYVTAIDTKGTLQWKFKGLEETKQFFFPRSVCCDSLMNIILSDFGNNSVLLLDKDGKFLMNLLSDKYGLQSPRGVCLDREGKLWVGQGDDGKGECHIVKYIK